MIEDSSGIATYKEYSAARAKTVGANKGKFNFFIPPSLQKILQDYYIKC